jgi:hypothetical protein
LEVVHICLIGIVYMGLIDCESGSSVWTASMCLDVFCYDLNSILLFIPTKRPPPYLRYNRVVSSYHILTARSGLSGQSEYVLGMGLHLYSYRVPDAIVA